MSKEDFIVRSPKGKAQAKPTKMDREKDQKAGNSSASIPKAKKGTSNGR